MNTNTQDTITYNGNGYAWLRVVTAQGRMTFPTPADGSDYELTVRLQDGGFCSSEVRRLLAVKNRLVAAL